MNGKYQPAITVGLMLGGVLIVIGVITALMPPLRLLGCCACLLPIGAGLLAVNQAVAKSAMPLSIGDGAILGLIAGAVAGLVNLIIGVPITYFINAATIEEQLAQLRQQAGIDLPFAGFALALVGGIIGIIIYAILSFIGGMIGIAVFEKRKDGAGTPPPPPPPGGYGGPTGTGYGDPTGGGYGGGSQPGGYGGGGAQGGGYGGAGGGAQGGGGWGGPGGSTGGGGSYGQGS